MALRLTLVLLAASAGVRADGHQDPDFCAGVPKTARCKTVDLIEMLSDLSSLDDMDPDTWCPCHGAMLNLAAQGASPTLKEKCPNGKQPAGAADDADKPLQTAGNQTNQTDLSHADAEEEEEEEDDINGRPDVDPKPGNQTDYADDKPVDGKTPARCDECFCCSAAMPCLLTGDRSPTGYGYCDQLGPEGMCGPAHITCPEDSWLPKQNDNGDDTGGNYTDDTKDDEGKDDTGGKYTDDTKAEDVQEDPKSDDTGGNYTDDTKAEDVQEDPKSDDTGGNYTDDTKAEDVQEDPKSDDTGGNYTDDTKQEDVQEDPKSDDTGGNYTDDTKAEDVQEDPKSDDTGGNYTDDTKAEDVQEDPKSDDTGGNYTDDTKQEDDGNSGGYGYGNGDGDSNAIGDTQADDHQGDSAGR
eukprot:COSAG05_NODE_2134_length_3502_cov_5.799222_3_plen_410_part_00